MIRKDRFSGKQFHRELMAVVIVATLAFGGYFFWKSQQAKESLRQGESELASYYRDKPPENGWQIQGVAAGETWLEVLIQAPEEVSHAIVVSGEAGATFALGALCPLREDEIWNILGDDLDVVMRLRSPQDDLYVNVSCRRYHTESARG